MATHDGRNVHDSAQPAVHTPIDSDASSIQATQCLCRTQQCSGERRRSARRCRQALQHRPRACAALRGSAAGVLARDERLSRSERRTPTPVFTLPLKGL